MQSQILRSFWIAGFSAPIGMNIIACQQGECPFLSEIVSVDILSLAQPLYFRKTYLILHVSYS